MLCEIEHTSRYGWCKLARRDSEPEGLGFEGGYDVWIRADRNDSHYLCDCLDRKESVRRDPTSHVPSHTFTKPRLNMGPELLLETMLVRP